MRREALRLEYQYEQELKPERIEQKLIDEILAEFTARENSLRSTGYLRTAGLFGLFRMLYLLGDTITIGQAGAQRDWASLGRPTPYNSEEVL